ncbi:MAG: 30S ribosomal protein S2 [Thermomicrobia bacterium]|nr:30S ribosomal protein S2 [Thermomicrobia bacterium]MCA1725205.1 30S ribosomal protein S2 [Thermomicrobia bacterium]
MATVMQTQYDPASTMLVMRQLLESGVHFGHQTKRWNPKMRPYIFSERNGIHIIDLQQTAEGMRRAQDFITSITAHGGKVLFVGTKKQAQEIVAEEASRAGMNYVNRRWMGGTLTNFVTIRARLRRLVEIEEMENSGAILDLPKKEQTSIAAEKEKLEKTIGGMRGMTRLPEAVFIVDPRREELAVKEASRLEIPIVAMVDTNSDPDVVNYVIPSNDDAIRSVRLLTKTMADAALEGRGQYYAATARREEPQRQAYELDAEDLDAAAAEKGDTPPAGR